MNRCLLASLIAAPLFITAWPCAAQATLPQAASAAQAAIPGLRNFPAHTQLGVLRIDQIPHATINGQAMRTAPGFRLFSADNKLIFAHTVPHQKLPVAYLVEASTQWLLTAWILTPEEQAILSGKR